MTVQRIPVSTPRGRQEAPPGPRSTPRDRCSARFVRPVDESGAAARGLACRRSLLLSAALHASAACTLVMTAGCMGIIDDPALGTGPGVEHAWPPDGSPCSAASEVVAAIPMRRLTRAEYFASVEALLGVRPDARLALPGDERVSMFVRNNSTPVTLLDADQLMAAAETIVASVDVPALTGCAGDRACLRAFVATYGRRAFRRPLEAEEVSEFDALIEEYGTTDGPVRVLEALLQSPQFLYHVELGTGDGSRRTLSSYEVAARLAFLLFEAPPDEALLSAAAAGELDTREGVVERAAQMLDDPRAEHGIRSFVTQWLELDGAPERAYDGFDESLWAAMVDSTVRFVDREARSQTGNVAELWTSSLAFIGDPRLAAIYGVEMPSDPSLPVMLDSRERAGLLTQPSLLAANAHVRDTSPTARGHLVRTRIFCDPVEPPPDGAEGMMPPLPADATQRMKAEARFGVPRCAGCHYMMDSIGLALDDYDFVGRFAATGVAPEGELVATDVDGPVTGAAELGERLGASGQVAACVASAFLDRALLRPPSMTSDACRIESLADRMRQPGGMRATILELVGSDGFRTIDMEEP